MIPCTRRASTPYAQPVLSSERYWIASETWAGPDGPALLVVRPHSENLDRPLPLQDLVDEPVLGVDAPRVSAREVADELLVTRRGLERVATEQLDNCGDTTLAR
jgi:hypothetical protein